jgi:vitamin B12/bleomycin/antimicrobial peptide transport system ATP-binding/permease protein
VPRLADRADWDKVLTEAERRRLAFARLHLLKPDIVLIDDGLHGLPEPDQAALFADLRAALAAAIMVTSGSGAVLEAAADLVLVRKGGTLQSTPAKARSPVQSMTVKAEPVHAARVRPRKA